MKKSLIILTMSIFCLESSSQVENPILPESVTAQQLESLAEQQNGEPEDDTFLQALAHLRKYKLDLNKADETDLKQFRLVSDIQIWNFFKYRKLLGPLLELYELQAIPGWDLETIEKIRPYVIIPNSAQLSDHINQAMAGGQHFLLLRLQQVVEKSNGYTRPDSVAIRYPGSPQKVFVRYKYVYKNLFQLGITGEKDPGEQFFRGNQKYGFDFYSYHIFARKLGSVRSLALGDFTVNLGQGLIHWQSLAFKKSADITAVKRQGAILRPYNSAGEYNFLRGAGITVGIKNFEVTAFASIRKLDGTVNSDTSQIDENYLSAILSSGYHRTVTEVAKKNAETQTSFGGNFSFNKIGFHLGVNGIAFKFSIPLNRSIVPYNQFAIRGDQWSNYSVDYSYTYRNFHFFGEAAVDQKHSKALLAGLMASLDTKVDASFVFRSIDKNYQTLYGNAFTEGSIPTNERGLFTGISVRPFPFLKIDAYADAFSFPWLRYRVDAPSHGAEYLVQVTYNPGKQILIYTRFKNDNKAINLTGTGLPTRQVYLRPKDSWRTHIAYNISRQVTFNQRVEVVWFDRREKERSQQGFMLYGDAGYRPNRALALNARLQYFETDGFESRLYAFESDVLYSYSIPQFSGRGVRYYINVNYDLTSKMTIWCRWGQTIYADQNSVGSGLDKIDGNRRSEVKFQVLYQF